MKNAQPVIEKTVGRIAVKGAPVNRSSQAYPPYQDKNRNEGKPREKGQTVFNKKIGKGPREKQGSENKQTWVNKKILYSAPVPSLNHFSFAGGFDTQKPGAPPFAEGLFFRGFAFIGDVPHILL
jgi:hypothetical protein